MIRIETRTGQRLVQLFLLVILLTVFTPTTFAQDMSQDNWVYLPVIHRGLTTNSTRPLALIVSPTSQSASIISPFADDNDNNNNATLYYRQTGTGTWLQGPTMSRDALSKEWRGSLVLLSPNTAYEIEVRYQDGGGVSPATVSASTQTLPDMPEVGSGGTIYTVPTQGNLETVLDIAQPGDTIQILAGTYHDSLTIEADQSGAPGAYITIEPASGAQVIFDGSDPNVNGAGDDWTFYTSSSQGDIYYIDLPWGDATVCDDSLPGYVGELFGGERRRYLLFDSEDSWNNDFLPAPAGKAYYVCNGSGPGPARRLYVVTISGDDPDNHDMHLAQLARGIYLRDADYIRIRGLQFRHYGWSGLHIGYGSQSGSDYNIVEDNTFHGIGQEHIRVSGKDGQEWTTNNIIQNNQFSEGGYRDLGWEWEVAYQTARSGVTGILLEYTGPGNVIRGNSVQAGHDGIVVKRGSDNVDVYNNIVTECMDDGLEVDNNPGQNIRIWGNTIENCYVAISLQDWNNDDPGPVYIFRNLLKGGDDPSGRTDHLGGTVGYTTYTTFKVGSDKMPTGSVYIYHNTVSLIQTTNDGAGIRDSGGDYFANAVTRNNIWNVSGRVFYFSSAQAVQNHDFDCDNLHDLYPGDTKFVRWVSGNNYTDLATFQTQTGQELNGISDASTGFDAVYNLLPGSPDIDAGCLVPSFNNNYAGAAPDLGAFESTP